MAAYCPSTTENMISCTLEPKGGSSGTVGIAHAASLKTRRGEDSVLDLPAHETWRSMWA